MPARIRTMDNTLPVQIVRCAMSRWLGHKPNRQQPVSEAYSQFLNGAVPFLILNNHCTEVQALELLEQIYKDICMERTLAGTVPVALQICAGTGFVSGIINGIIMVATGFHYFFCMMFLICVVLVSVPLFYRRKHQCEYQIVKAWEECAPNASSVFAALESIHSKINMSNPSSD